MNRISIPISKYNPHFIGSWNIQNDKLCDELIDYFEINIDKQKKGRVGGGLDLSIKNSTDISISPKDINKLENNQIRDYIENLFFCYKDYLSQWPFLNSFASNVEIGNFNIQRYHAGEHFQQVHSERTSISTLHRLFAWMTYLNDVEEGGTTFFSHYDIEIKPKKGLTLIWPAEWTHAHRGNILPFGSKYIVTGWIDLSS